jgi:hypothetical protein
MNRSPYWSLLYSAGLGQALSRLATCIAQALSQDHFFDRIML